MQAHPVLSYLYDCFYSESQGSSFWNFSDKKVEFARFFPGNEQILSEDPGFITLDQKYAEEVFNDTFKYTREKDLIYGHLYLVGKTKVRDEYVPVCAPLLLYPAQIYFKEITTKNEVPILRLKGSGRQVNFQMIQALVEDPEIAASIYEELSLEIPDGSLTQSDLAGLESVLKDQLPEVSCSEMYLYPELLPRKEVMDRFKAAKKKKKASLHLLPASTLTLVPKSRSVRGVLHELGSMAKGMDTSETVKIFLGEKANSVQTQPDLKTNNVPANLSEAQEKVLEKASSQRLTLVIGPPGTGKSFTISALALEAVSRGERVLIASRKDHAVDVVGKKIENTLGVWGAAVRGGNKQYYKDLVQHLDNLLHGIKTYGLPPSITLYKSRLEMIHKEMQEEKRKLAKELRFQMKWGHFLAKERSRKGRFGIIRSLKRWYYDRKTDELENIARSFDRVSELNRERNSILTKYLVGHFDKRRDLALHRDRKTFFNFLRAIRARSSHRQEMFFEDVEFEQLLFAFPIWLVNMQTIYKVLPFQKDLFDLLIIDEASQCDMASCLPLIQRAKRVVIVGDPRQLRHISFLSRSQMASFAKDRGMDSQQQDRYNYREKSILDLAQEVITDQENIIFLNEHFRSLPDIIRFSNREFYGNALRIMKGNPLARRQRNLEMIRVEGQRDEQGINREEADRLLKDLKQLVVSQRRLGKDYKQSIGILSPFRDQVDYLHEQIYEKLSAQAIMDHDIAVGTAHTFQGEERDVMLISLVLDPDSHPNSFHYLNRADLFNVSITRARNYQYIYCSLDPAGIPRDTLLYRYLSYLSSEQSYAAPQKGQALHDQFLQEVCGVFEQWGAKTWPEYPLAGLEIDLVVEMNGKVLGFDLIGFPGKFAPAFSLDRYEILQRSGLPIVPLSFVYWEHFREKCLEELQQLFS